MNMKRTTTSKPKNQSIMQNLLNEAFEAGHEYPYELKDSILNDIIQSIDDTFSSITFNISDKIPNYISQLIRQDDSIVLSGGAVLRLLLGKPNKGVWQGDWDFFTTKDTFIKKVVPYFNNYLGLTPQNAHYLAQKKSKYEIYSGIIESESCHVMVLKDELPPNNTMLNLATYDFDITICQVAYNMQGLFIGTKALNDIMASRFRKIQSHISQERISKYKSRGFRFEN